MVNEELKKYFEENIKNGFSIEELKKATLEQGHDANEIENIITSLNINNKEQKSVLQTLLKIPTLYISLLFLISFLGLIYINYSKSSVYSYSGKIVGYNSNISMLLILIVFVILISMFLSLFYYLKQENKSNFWRIVISTYISLIISIMFSSLVILFFGFVILPNFNFPSDLLIIFLITFVPCITFFICYLYLKIFLINKLTEEFNFETFFKFKHFPFSIWNIFSTKNENVKLSVIKSSIFSSVLFFFVIFYFFSLTFIDTMPDINDMSPSLSSDMNEKIKPYLTILEIKNYSNIQIKILDEKRFFGEWADNYVELSILKDKGNIYYKCDIYLENCKNKEIEVDKKISEIIDISEYDFYVYGYKNKTYQDIYLVHELDLKEIYTNDIFFATPEISKTKIGKEINKKYNEYALFYENSLNRIPVIKSDTGVLYWYYFENLDGFNQTSHDGWDLLTMMIYNSIFLNVAYDVYEDLKINEFHDKNFPYNSTTIDEYEQRLRENIENLELMDDKVDDKEIDIEEVRDSCKAQTYQNYQENSIFQNAIRNIGENNNFNRLLRYILTEGCTRFGSIDFASNIHNHDMIKETDFLNDTFSKVVKLNIQQNSMQYKVKKECLDVSCILKIAEITQDVNACIDTGNRSEEIDSCILKYSIEDNFHCSSISNYTKRKECDSKFE